MAFEDEVKKYIDTYVIGHLPNMTDVEKQFLYIRDDELKTRIIKEYFIARYVYKFFEGMHAKDELLEAEVRLQVIMYANIYEAIIHYVLFSLYKDYQLVIDLEYIKAPIQVSIPEVKKAQINKALEHEGKEIKTYYDGIKKRDITKVRFDDKAEVAFQLGLIDESLKDELVYFYNLRNGIHLHAEIRKQIVWDIEMSKLAFWRIEKINQLVSQKINEDKK